MPSRDYPDKRRSRGTGQKANLKLFSARIEEALLEYVNLLAYETRRSKQDIISEALLLYKQNNLNRAGTPNVQATSEDSSFSIPSMDLTSSPL